MNDPTNSKTTAWPPTLVFQNTGQRLFWCPDLIDGRGFWVDSLAAALDPANEPSGEEWAGSPWHLELGPDAIADPATLGSFYIFHKTELVASFHPAGLCVDSGPVMFDFEWLKYWPCDECSAPTPASEACGHGRAFLCADCYAGE